MNEREEGFMNKIAIVAAIVVLGVLGAILVTAGLVVIQWLSSLQF